MDLATIFNIAGVIISIPGTLLVSFNSPKMEPSGVFLTSNKSDSHTSANKKNKLARYGLIIICFGIILNLGGIIIATYF